ncbi:MAG TPA: hypothetical protein VN581_13665 [Patescibacteria group bacterium]|nr:hypothetical protein [Patescibacteria group bacterium]
MRIWIGLLLAACGTLAQACSCTIGSADASFDRAEHVFVARITQIEDIASMSRWKFAQQDEDWDPEVGVDYGLRMRFEVETTIKGDPRSLPHLVTGYGGGDCGVPVLPGGYLLVATDPRGEVRYCSLGRELRLLNCADIEWLDRLRKRAADGTTPAGFNPLGIRDVKPGTLRELMKSGRNPFTLTGEACPTIDDDGGS